MKHRLAPLAIMAALALPLAGCAAPAATTPAETSAPATATTPLGSAPAPSSAAARPVTYPRTVTLDGQSVTIPKEAKRIVALSSDVADVLLSLAGPERLAGVPSLSSRPEMSRFAESAKKVPAQLDPNAGKDAEKLLALNPDLVLLTSRHEAEQTALKQLREAGIPVLAVTNDWENPEVFARNVRALAQTVGADAKGEQLVNEHRARWEKVTTALKDEPSKPVTAVIRILGPNTWLNGPGTMGYTVTQAAGATSAADLAGLKADGKLDVEQLVKVDPAYIVVVDSSGKGRDQYAKILDNPGLASVDAIKNGRVLVVTSADMSSGTGAVDALEKIAKLVHPDKVA